MDWASLFADARFPGAARRDDPQRNPFQVDQDRIVFSRPFRRLQRKTQVHPLPSNAHIRNRLVHTLEVASVGTVKFYKPEMGLGVISVQGLDRDVFVHASVLTRSGLVALTGGQKLALTYAKGHKGLEARTVKPI